MPKIKNIYTSASIRGNTQQRTQQTIAQLTEKANAALRQGGNQFITPRYSRHPRDAVTVSCNWWLRQGRAILLYCNPTDMRWSLPLRGTVVKTTAGAVRNTWRNRFKGTYFDEGTVNVTFQTGNIMPSMGYADDSALASADLVASAIANPQAPPGLDNFYEFMALRDVPMLWGAGENRHVMIHHSRVFPNIRLEGYFTEDSFNFSEVATDGNRLIWEATFQIYKATPWFSNFHAQLDEYRNFIATKGMAEQIGEDNLDRYRYVEGVSSVPGASPAGQPKRQLDRPSTVATSGGNANQNIVDNAANSVSQRTLDMIGAP